MDIASNGCKQNGSLATLIGLFHEWLKQSNCSLHYLGGLQHEWQLHLALAKALPNNLHALEQVIIDDVQWLDAVGAC